MRKIYHNIHIQNRKRLPLEENYDAFFSAITDILMQLKNVFLKLKIVTTKDESSNKEVIAIEIAFSYTIQFILYKVLVDKRIMDTHKEFNRIKKTVLERNNKNINHKIMDALEEISFFMSKKKYYPYHKEQQEIIKKVYDYYHSNNNYETAPFSLIYHLIKNYNFSNINNDILGPIYENFLKTINKEKHAGQYFTAPAIVNYMLNEIGYTPQTITTKNQDNISIIDPSCGSGTFLYSATQAIMKGYPIKQTPLDNNIGKVIANNVYGIDKYAFPLYLAEMNIIMQSLPIMPDEAYNSPTNKPYHLYHTEDSLAEYIHENCYANSNSDIPKKSTENAQNNEDVPIITNKINTKTRFDYVIGNPPYISYNQCCKDEVALFRMIKKKVVKLSNVFDWNLHSVPGDIKKYSPKPNLYGFFIALGITLLKKGGKLCYIIPKTLLTSGSLDVVRYELVKRTTLLKIITFQSNLFINRGENMSDKILTSSLILLCENTKPTPNHNVNVVTYNGEAQNITDVFLAIKKTEKKYTKEISQKYLLEHYKNWNIIQHDKSMVEVYDKYNANGQPMSVYYDHQEAQKQFGCNFWFDNGYIIDEKKVLAHSNDDTDYYIPKKSRGTYQFKVLGYWKNERNKQDEYYIKLSQANQKYNFLDAKYKVIWSYTNPNKMYFSNDEKIIWPRNKYYGIGSSNYEEALYLFSLLNSTLSFTLYKLLLKNENEKNILLSNTFIKNYVRPPLINTEEKKKIKQKIIALTDKMLALEKDITVNILEIGRIKLQIDGLVCTLYNFEDSHKRSILHFNL